MGGEAGPRECLILKQKYTELLFEEGRISDLCAVVVREYS